MKPAAFAYHRPRTLDEALSLLATHGEDAKLLAGGQSLGPMLNMRLAQPGHLVDINQLHELAHFRDDGAHIEVGSLVRHCDLSRSELVRSGCPLLSEAAATIGHYAIRQRGTLGGSLAHADPAAQLPLVSVALDARIEMAGPRGRRAVQAAEFFVSLMTTVLEPDEIVVAARFPKLTPGESHAFVQFTRRHGDFALAAVAVTLALDGAGRARSLRLAVGGAQATPRAHADLAARAIGRAPDDAWINEIAASLRETCAATENPRVPAIFRRELVGVLAERALAQAIACARAG